MDGWCSVTLPTSTSIMRIVQKDFLRKFNCDQRWSQNNDLKLNITKTNLLRLVLKDV